MAAAAPAILCENLVKIYKVADLEVVALQGLDLSVDSGELVAIVGASGSGKSTLQNILGGVDTPTAGRVEVGGQDLTSLSEARAHALPPPHGRVRLAADVSQPAAVPDRRGERRAADDARGREAEGSPAGGCVRCSTSSGSAVAPRTGPTRSPAASSSASRSRSRSRTGRACCSRTSRPASSTATTRRTCSRRCRRCLASSASPSSC